MAQGIQDFYRVARQRQFNRDFQLRVVSWNFDLPENEDVLTEEDLVLLRTAVLPEITTTINTAPYMGLDFNVPGTTKFPGSQNWAVEFYSTQQQNIRARFERAMLRRFDYLQSSTGNLQLPQKGSIVELQLVDDQLRALNDRIYTLVGAFITNLGAVNYDMTASGAVQRVPATVAYQYWYSTSQVGGLAADPTDGNEDGFEE